MYQVRDPIRRVPFIGVDQSTRASDSIGGEQAFSTEFEVRNQREAEAVAKCIQYLLAGNVKLPDKTALGDSTVPYVSRNCEGNSEPRGFWQLSCVSC